MLVVEGYKMAEGTATVQFLNQQPRKINGVFLFRPDKVCQSAFQFVFHGFTSVL